MPGFGWSSHTQRGILLYQRRKLELAVSEFREAILQTPHDGHAHGWLGICLVDLKQHEPAIAEVQQGVHLAPGQPFSHYALAYVLERCQQFAAAKRAIQEAIRLNPSAAHQWGLLASVEFHRQEWDLCLQAAREGLRLDAENAECARFHALALVYVGHKNKGQTAIYSALQRAPENALVHMNAGWTMLHQGDTVQAVEHFREALRLDPNLPGARQGVIEALKARNRVYRRLLASFLWVSTLSVNKRALLFMGLMLIGELLWVFAVESDGTRPYLPPLVVAYTATGLLTLISGSLFNLLLRFDPLGRHVLSREQITATNLLVVLLAISALAVGAYFWIGGRAAALVAAEAAALTLPVCMIARPNPARPGPRRFRIIALLAALGIASVAVSGHPTTSREFNELLFYGAVAAFGLGCFLTILANPPHARTLFGKRR